MVPFEKLGNLITFAEGEEEEKGSKLMPHFTHWLYTQGGRVVVERPAGDSGKLELAHTAKTCTQTQVTSHIGSEGSNFSWPCLHEA